MGAACAWVRAARTFGASLPKRTTSRTMRRKAGRSRLLRCANTVSRSPTEALRAHARIEGGRRGPASGRMRWLHALLHALLQRCCMRRCVGGCVHCCMRWRCSPVRHAPLELAAVDRQRKGHVRRLGVDAERVQEADQVRVRRQVVDLGAMGAARGGGIMHGAACRCSCCAPSAAHRAPRASPHAPTGGPETPMAL